MDAKEAAREAFEQSLRRKEEKRKKEAEKAAKEKAYREAIENRHSKFWSSEIARARVNTPEFAMGKAFLIIRKYVIDFLEAPDERKMEAARTLSYFVLEATPSDGSSPVGSYMIFFQFVEVMLQTIEYAWNEKVNAGFRLSQNVGHQIKKILDSGKLGSFPSTSSLKDFLSWILSCFNGTTPANIKRINANSKHVIGAFGKGRNMLTDELTGLKTKDLMSKLMRMIAALHPFKECVWEKHVETYEKISKECKAPASQVKTSDVAPGKASGQASGEASGESDEACWETIWKDVEPCVPTDSKTSVKTSGKTVSSDASGVASGQASGKKQDPSWEDEDVEEWVLTGDKTSVETSCGTVSGEVAECEDNTAF